MEVIASQLMAALLVSLRIAPTLAFAPPFTLLRVPATARLLLAIGLAVWICLANPSSTYERLGPNPPLAALALAELLLGITLSLSLQIAFAALQTAGRALDIQVGFALAQIADPTLRTQMPLVGTLFAYAAGAAFFATNGPADLLAIWSHSVEAVPLGAFRGGDNLPAILGFIGAAFVLALAIAGGVLLVLFLTDVAIAALSRTLPQMNVLVLGFQVKTLALLMTLPFVFAFSGALFLRLIRLAIGAAPQFI